jgi:hypothetical protein
MTRRQGPVGGTCTGAPQDQKQMGLFCGFCRISKGDVLGWQMVEMTGAQRCLECISGHSGGERARALPYEANRGLPIDARQSVSTGDDAEE